MKEGRSAVFSKEFVSRNERRTERLMLSLRTTQGLDLQKFEHDFGENLLKSKSKQIKKLQEMKMIEIVDGFMKITDDHFYVSNSIIVELM